MSAIVTHEHQDHVNGLTPTTSPASRSARSGSPGPKIRRTTSPTQLRKKFKDRLLGLIDARASLHGPGTARMPTRLEWYLEFELGEDVGEFNGAAHAAAGGKDPRKSANKVAMKFLATARRETRNTSIRTEGARGAGREERARLRARPAARHRQDRRPRSGRATEDFGHGFGAGRRGRAATRRKASPFPRRHVIPLDKMFTDPSSGRILQGTLRQRGRRGCRTTARRFRRTPPGAA